MGSEEAQVRIALHVKIDLLIECLDAPDEEGVVWRDDAPYDLVVTEGKVYPPEPPESADDEQWLIAALIGTAIGLLVAVTVWLALLWSIYAAMGVILWLMVNSVP